MFFGSGVANLATSRLKNRPARLKSPSEAVIESSSKTASDSVTVTASLPKQSIVLTRSASVPFKKQKTKPLEYIHYKLNQRAYKASFYRASVLKITTNETRVTWRVAVSCALFSACPLACPKVKNSLSSVCREATISQA